MEKNIFINVFSKLIIESSKEKINTLLDSGLITQEENNIIFGEAGGNIIAPFKNEVYFQIFKNSRNAGIKDTLKDYIDFFKDFQEIQKVYNNFTKQGKPVIISDISTNTVDITGKLIPTTDITINDIKKYYIVSLNKKETGTNMLNLILDEGVKEYDRKHFEVVLNNDNWIICKIKTVIGSIAVARSFWENNTLKYDKIIAEKGKTAEFANIGIMNWCTSTISSDNEFFNYVSSGIHMFYCTKKMINKSDPKRKLIIGLVYDINSKRFIAADDNYKINVDAANIDNIPENEMANTIGRENYEYLRNYIDPTYSRNISLAALKAENVTKESEQMILARYNSPYVNFSLLENEKLHINVIKYILPRISNNPYLKLVMAENNNTQLEQLIVLSKTRNPDICCQIMLNINCTAELASFIVNNVDGKNFKNWIRAKTRFNLA